MSAMDHWVAAKDDWCLKPPGSVVIQSAFFLPKGEDLPDRLVIDFKIVSGDVPAHIEHQLMEI